MAINKENKRRLNELMLIILYLQASNNEAKEYYFIKIKYGLYYGPEIVHQFLPLNMKGVDFENIIIGIIYYL